MTTEHGNEREEFRERDRNIDNDEGQIKRKGWREAQARASKGCKRVLSVTLLITHSHTPTATAKRPRS